MSFDKKDASHEQVLKDRMEKAGYDEEEIEAALKSWEVTRSLISESFDDINSSDKCLFCKQEPIQEKHVYASTIIAHKEPLSKKKTLFGLSRKTANASIGSLVPVNIPICKKCKQTYVLRANIRLVTIVVSVVIFGAIAWGFKSLSVDAETLSLIQLSITGFGAVFGYFISKVIERVYLKKVMQSVHMNIFDVKPLDVMKKNGWFVLQDNNDMTRFNFIKKYDEFGKVFDQNS